MQAFRINLWENIKANNRCGGCHNANGQTPQFARNDDVNLAYQAANTIVNLAQPDQSRMVIKVAGGHNCWLQSPSACADTLTVWIRNWAGSTATGGTQIQLLAPDDQGSGRQQGLPADRHVAAFRAARSPSPTRSCTRWCATPARPIACAAIPRARPRSSSRSSRTRIRKIGLRGHQVEDQSRQPGSVASGGAPARRVPQLLGHARVARPTRDDHARPRSTNSPTRSPVTNVDPDLLISKGLTLYDGTVAAGGNRYEAATIAKYEFKTGMGAIVYDTSGHEPALNLTMSGDVDLGRRLGHQREAGRQGPGHRGRVQETHRPHQVDR